MSVQPVLLYFDNQPEPTEEQIDAAYTYHLNTALAFERMIALAPHVKWPIVVKAQHPLSYSGEVNENQSLWADVLVDLVQASLLPQEEFYSVIAMGMNKGGLGLPVNWTGWYEEADPNAGALTVIGQQHLNEVMAIAQLASESNKRKLYTSVQREAYLRNVWLLAHEWFHASGCDHWMGDPRNSSFARITITNYLSLRHYLNATMKTVGGTRRELETLRRSRLWDHLSDVEYIHVYLTDRPRMLDGSLSLKHGLGAGMLVQEYR